MDYTKYGLKPDDEIKNIFREINSIFNLWCKKCYKKYKTDIEPECERLNEILGEENSKIKGWTGIDFLCNNHHTAEKLIELGVNSFDSIGIIACGLGVQFVSEKFPDKRIFALCDSIPQSRNSTSPEGFHGASLGEEKCAACSQCYLNLTGGICPIVNCSKSLLNGPCGGVKNGKCEVNPDIPCAWEDIYNRLKKQNKLFCSEIQVRDFNRFNFDEKKKYSEISLSKRQEGFYGGVHPLDSKENTSRARILNFPEPPYVLIFISQHTGSLSKPIVKEGDTVKMGQKIAESTGVISSTIHSSISGRVVKIEEKIHPTLQKPIPAIIIENNGKNTMDESIKPVDFEGLSKENIIEILKEKGIVGLGGAMFPTYVKFLFEVSKKSIETLIVNGCECEPYLNTDNRIMIEYPEKILKGIKVLQKIANPKNTIIGIEDNKKEAIEILQKYSSSDITVLSLRTKYPQGAEKMLIKRLTGKNVPEGGLPIEVGSIVINVGTALAIYKAIFEGIPLIDRVITVSGDGVGKDGNFIVKIGTPLKNILDFYLGMHNKNIFEEYNIFMGGPMMGILQKNLDSAVIKGTGGFTILKKYPVESKEERECIKCGRCVSVCPVELLPLNYVYYGEKQMWEETKNYRVKNCIECGSCNYICSSKIDILSFIKRAKGKCL